jgi:acyl transferase domain-containing protein
VRSTHRVAIIGVGVRAAGGIVDLPTFWAAVENGGVHVGDLPAGRRRVLEQEWDGALRGGFLPDVLGFDARFFGISPREARSMDPQHRLLLEVVWEAFEDAALVPADVAASTGVVIGITGQDHRDWRPSKPGPDWVVGNGHCFAAGRVAYTLGLEGPAMAVDTACSSSLVALHTAAGLLAAGECDVALAGAVNLVLSPRSVQDIGCTGAYSPDGRCRPFDARANGFVRGEGAAVLVLKRLDDALRDGDRVHAVVEASGTNQDGRSPGFTAPSGAAQVRLITSVLERAGIGPADIGYLEAHGTGTPLGDPIELEAVAAGLGRPSGGAPLYVGSVKGNVGHAEAAAGALGVLKAVLCLQRRCIPPQAGFAVLNPRIDLSGTGMRVPTGTVTWGADAGAYAAVSSFGMSGTNAHAVLSAAPAQQTPSVPDVAGFVVSADTTEALHVLAARLRARLTELDVADYPAFAHTVTHGRARRRTSVLIEAADPAQAGAALDALAAGADHPSVQPLGPGRTVPAVPRQVVTLPVYPWQRVEHSIAPVA